LSSTEGLCQRVRLARHLHQFAVKWSAVGRASYDSAASSCGPPLGFGRSLGNAMTAGTLGPRYDADQPLSPELALVDPELARWARARLPSLDPDVLARPVDVVPALPAIRDPAPHESVSASYAERLPVEATARPRPRLRFLVLFVAGALLGLGALLLRHEVRAPVDGGARAKHTAPAKQAAVGRDSIATTRAPATHEDRSQPAPTSSTAARSTPPPHVQGQATTPSPPRPPAAPEPRPPAARRFVWVRDPRATYYDVSFFRNGTKIFGERPTQPALTLPPTWTYHGHRYALAPGHYTWVVRPWYGPPRRGELGTAIVRSSLVIG
jgi:hypothetical protein